MNYSYGNTHIAKCSYQVLEDEQHFKFELSFELLGKEICFVL